MSKEKKKETIRLVLAEMEKNLDDLREEIGSKFVRRWGKMARNEQDEKLCSVYPQIIEIWKGLRYVQFELLNIGRPRDRSKKLNAAMISRIKQNGKWKVTALARELGISRQTIYTVLRKP